MKEAEIVLCVAIIENIYISVIHLKWQLSKLQLYHCQSEPDSSVNYIVDQLRYRIQDTG